MFNIHLDNLSNILSLT